LALFLRDGWNVLFIFRLIFEFAKLRKKSIRTAFFLKKIFEHPFFDRKRQTKQLNNRLLKKVYSKSHRKRKKMTNFAKRKKAFLHQNFELKNDKRHV